MSEAVIIGDATLHHGDCMEVLAGLETGSVQCVVTSPPYWGLRDYGVEGQIGLEEDLEDYLAKILKVFHGVKRVLSEDGTLWLNLGDAYSSAEKNGLPKKQLLGLPWWVAFELQSAGWFLRCDIIWSKPNPMPESVTDRPTRAHEYIFLMSKSPKYFYNHAAIKEPGVHSSKVPGGWDTDPGAHGTFHRKGRADKQRGHSRKHAGFNERWDHMTTVEQSAMGRNKRSVWTVATQPFPEAHFATFPEKLIEPCILAGSRPGDVVLDPFAGSGTVGVVCAKNGRRFVGAEINRDYIAMASRRIKDAQSQQRLALDEAEQVASKTAPKRELFI